MQFLGQKYYRVQLVIGSTVFHQGGQSKKFWNFKVLQSMPCWYSKLVSWDAWHNAKDEKLIRLSCDEKTSKNCWNSTKFDFTQFSIVFERFLSPGRSDLCLVFCIVSGIKRHKFKVPTKGTLVDFFFLIKGFVQKLQLIAGDQDGWKKAENRYMAL